MYMSQATWAVVFSLFLLLTAAKADDDWDPLSQHEALEQVQVAYDAQVTREALYRKGWLRAHITYSGSRRFDAVVETSWTEDKQYLKVESVRDRRKGDDGIELDTTE